jgi:putative transposase
MNLNTYFFTATILNWNNLLAGDKYKNIVAESLQFLTENNRIRVFGFVIMPNHIHLIWKILNPH